jgi:hypothetical protein
MFWITKQQSVEKKLSQMNHLLAKSFSNVRNDTQRIFQWLNFLYQKNMDQANQIKQLQVELSYMPKSPDDIRRIVDSYYSFETISERIKLLNEKIDALSVKKESEAYERPKVHHTNPEMQEIEQRLKHLEEQKQATIREKVVSRITRNSKEYVKNLVLSYIRKYNQIGALQLKDMIVHDQGLCSKSSFYRLLDEIEKLDEVGTAKKGKQKYYLYKQVREQ